MATGMDSIAEAVLRKVRAEAEGILADANAKADEAVAKARAQRDARLAAERTRLLEEAKVEAARIMAQSALSSRRELLAAKAAVVEEVFSAAKAALAASAGSADALTSLIAEGVARLGREKARVLVSSRDLAGVTVMVRADRELGARVAEVKEAAIDGGTIVEDPAGSLRVDNSYATRLAMARPAMLVEIGSTLLKS
jgi:V/A-type H+/Na+-transporting ATPase subunit E